MRCFVLSDNGLWKDLFRDAQAVDIVVVERDQCKPGTNDILFDLRMEAWDMELYAEHPHNPVFVSAITGTLIRNNAPKNVVRINGWPGMLEKPLLEAAADEGIREKAQEIMKRLNRTLEWVPDKPGMVSPRVISMIINEAWFAFEEGVSSKQDIDTAMKLGTNYPFGPFEWGDKIGLSGILGLLRELERENQRYTPAPSLIKEAMA